MAETAAGLLPPAGTRDRLRALAWAPVELAGWGRATRARTFACRPATVEAAGAAFCEAPAPVVAYAAGRSYGDAALNAGGRTILTGALDRILAFDPASGEVVCEAGVTFRRLLERFLPEGFLVPVSPGTAYITVGGAVANDVHGKNHEGAGSFGRHVRWLDLALPSGEILRVTPEDEPELFRATLGGIGLTGLILRACVRLQRVPSGVVLVEEQRARDLDAFMAAFEASRARATFSVGWFDALARGRHFGRGILETAEFAPDAALPLRLRRPCNVPFDLPPGLLNPLTIRLFNEVYFRRVPAGGRRRPVRVERFLYPLDCLGDWNRIYGPGGFFQFQCVIPDHEAGAGIQALLEAIGATRQGSFLAVLKTLGESRAGHLSFPRRGWTLALDFPRTRRTRDLLRRLEAIALAHAGRVYLAKDALLSAAGFRAMYPELAAFCAVLDRIDPERRLASDMARRLRIREG